jgi:hypothetical protein
MTVERSRDRGTSLYAVARPNLAELAAHVLPTPSRSVRFLTAVIEFLGYNPLLSETLLRSGFRDTSRPTADARCWCSRPPNGILRAVQEAHT